MEKYFLAVIAFVGLIIMNSCGVTDDRESIARNFLQEKISSESKSTFKVDDFSKTNGYEQDLMGMKIYTIEFQTDISTTQEIWKRGDLLSGYWGDFSVWTQAPTGWEASASLHKHFGQNAKFHFTGECQLQQTENGWRGLKYKMKSMQTLSEGSASTNSSGVGVGNPGANPNGNYSENNNASSTITNTGNFKGAWFEIWIPTNFKVIPSLKSSSSSDGYESAFFRSPDSKVEFYIFSPQWNGEPSDIAVNTATEKQISTESKPSGNNIITWVTIKANDGHYTRAYQDTKAKDGSTRWVVGIKYSDQNSYNNYKEDYLKFKKSLQQFAD